MHGKILKNDGTFLNFVHLIYRGVKYRGINFKGQERKNEKKNFGLYVTCDKEMVQYTNVE